MATPLNRKRIEIYLPYGLKGRYFDIRVISKFFVLCMFFTICNLLRINIFTPLEHLPVLIVLSVAGVFLDKLAKATLDLIVNIEPANVHLVFLNKFSKYVKLTLTKEYTHDKIPVEELSLAITFNHPVQQPTEVRGMSSYRYLTDERGFSRDEVKALQIPAKDNVVQESKEVKSLDTCVIERPGEHYIGTHYNKRIYIKLDEKTKVPNEMLKFYNGALAKGYIERDSGPGICNSDLTGFYYKWRPNGDFGDRIFCNKILQNEDGSETWLFDKYIKKAHNQKTVSKSLPQENNMNTQDQVGHRDLNYPRPK